ncbi:MAG: 16S rRNA (cytosine(1402)-N(4))-methyltransferase RsmH [Methylococcaceae bacterium]|nr:16S rRNA (cytosine(1402)-N(4))-methyltransferase RsmH [Methylococcaceae bacterium]
MAEHLPVMPAEVLDALAIVPDGVYVDGTFGRGGHSREILARLDGTGRLLALDKDAAALSSIEASLLREDGRFELVQSSFARLAELCELRGWTGKVAGVLLDLGVSSPQLDEAERGFSFLRDGPLDMRMDTNQGPTAAEWLATVDEAELARVLREYGEERFAGRIARAVVARRPLLTTGQLVAVIEAAVPTREKNKHPATRSFQAIRIAINRELEELREVLKQAVEVLRPGGRLTVISFHSLEDRIVKRFIRDCHKGAMQPPHLPPLVEHRPTLRAVGRAQMPGRAETAANPRSRSAVLRVAERLSA